MNQCEEKLITIKEHLKIKENESSNIFDEYLNYVYGSCSSRVLCNARSEVFIFYCLNYSVGFWLKVSILGTPFSCFFSVMLGLQFEPACSRPCSVSDNVMNSPDYTKPELVKAWLFSSSRPKFPTVLILAVFPFALNFQILVIGVIVLRFWTLLFALVNFNFQEGIYSDFEGIL